MHTYSPRAGLSRIPLALGLTLVLVACAQREKEEKELPVPQSLDELDRALDQVLAECNVPGLGVALTSADELTWARGFGKADLARGRTVDEGTVFRMGSISKSFVSLAALLLVEEGRLQLDAPIGELAPEIEFTNPWEATEPVRLVHLLEHTSGFDDIHACEYAQSVPNIRLRDGLAFHPHSRTVRWPPGRYFSYSNSGPALAAYVVEKIAGERFEDFVRARLFEPLGMTTADFFPSANIQAHLSKSYRSDGLTEIPFSHIIVRPSGSLSASPRDLTALVRLLLQRGTYEERHLLAPASIERMETATASLTAHAGLPVGYGLGNYSSPGRGLLFRGHDGGIDGFLASYGYLPEHGRGYVFAINQGDGEAFERIAKLIQGYLVHDLPKLEAKAVRLSPEALETFTGYYEPITPRQELTRFLERILGIVRLREREGHLVLSPFFGEDKQMVAVGERLFREEDEAVATVVVLEDPAGDLLLSGFGRVVEGSYRHLSPWRAWLRWTGAVGSLILMASSLLFGFYWLPRRAYRRWRGKKRPGLGVRAVPLLATLSLAAVFVIFSLTGELAIERLGVPNAWSWSVWVLTWLFAALSAAGVFLLLAGWRREPSKAVRLHSLLVSMANLVVLVYLARFGLIGLRTWA